MFTALTFGKITVNFVGQSTLNSAASRNDDTKVEVTRTGIIIKGLGYTALKARKCDLSQVFKPELPDPLSCYRT